MTFLGIKTKAAIESVLHTNHPEFMVFQFYESQQKIIYSIREIQDVEVEAEILKRRDLVNVPSLIFVIAREIPCNTLRNAVKFMSLIQAEVKSAVEQYNEGLKG